MRRWRRCAAACWSWATRTASRWRARDKLELLFEEPEEVRFVISPNSAARQIWISALSTSFKLGWSESAGAFVMEKTGETLTAVMSRILTQQLGSAVAV